MAEHQTVENCCIWGQEGKVEGVVDRRRGTFMFFFLNISVWFESFTTIIYSCMADVILKRQ
jgi:hypothetical protein